MLQNERTTVISVAQSALLVWEKVLLRINDHQSCGIVKASGLLFESCWVPSTSGSCKAIIRDFLTWFNYNRDLIRDFIGHRLGLATYLYKYKYCASTAQYSTFYFVQVLYWHSTSTSMSYYTVLYCTVLAPVLVPVLYPRPQRELLRELRKSLNQICQQVQLIQKSSYVKASVFDIKFGMENHQ